MLKYKYKGLCLLPLTQQQFVQSCITYQHQLLFGQALTIGQSYFVLFWCYSCVYNTIKTMKVLFTDPVSTTAELDLLIRILSPLTKILLFSTSYSYNILQLNTLLQDY